MCAGTPTPNRLGDYTGRHFEEGITMQTPALVVVRHREGAGGEEMTDPQRWRGDGELGFELRFIQQTEEVTSTWYILKM